MKRVLLLILLLSSAAAAQTPTELKDQEAEVTKWASTIEGLKELHSDGLIARLELEKAEKELAAAKAKVEQTREQIAAAERGAAEQKKAAELAKIKPLVKQTSMALNSRAMVLRSTAGSWSLAGLSEVQQFFSQTFGRPLPTSTVGQSATHNRMGWNHQNAVDVALHPDSAEGRVLIDYLQSSGIPFIAFRSAKPGVSTGPHIHIGSPSQRIS